MWLVDGLFPEASLRLPVCIVVLPYFSRPTTPGCSHFQSVHERMPATRKICGELPGSGSGTSYETVTGPV